MLLTVLTLFPAIGALLIAIYPQEDERESMWIAFGVSAATFVGSIYLFATFVADSSAFQFKLPKPLEWIPSLGISFQVGLDGISILLYVLTALITPLAILSAGNHIKTRKTLFFAMVLLLETAMLGAFAALDLFLFYVFWELMLIPMYFIIGIWGGKRRIYAAVKFFLFTLAGSLPMFLAILYIYFQYQAQFVDGGGSFVLSWLNLTQLKLSNTEQFWLFAAFAVSFAVKVPMFPLHTWLPDAHVEAPTSGSIILAGILLKMGGYGFLRFALVLFPAAAHAFAPYLIGLCIAGIIYGALVAMVQEDIKSLIAYSSVSHMAVVMLGVFTLTANGIQGGIYQMLSHGFSTGALFLLVGMIYDRRHTRLIADYGGIAKVMPLYAAGFLLVTLASIGLPGTNGFVGEFLVLMGAFQRGPWIAFGAGTGVILGAWYMLRMYRHVFQGPITQDENRHLKDFSRLELATFLPFVFFIILLGVYPQPFLAKTAKSVDRLLLTLEMRAPIHEAPGENPHHASLRPPIDNALRADPSRRSNIGKEGSQPRTLAISANATRVPAPAQTRILSPEIENQ